MSDKKVNHVLIKNAIDQYNDYWKWGNEVLYTMCEKNSFKKGENMLYFIVGIAQNIS